MNIQQLAQEIQQGRVGPLYLIHGGDPWQTHQAIEAVRGVIPVELRQMNQITLPGKGLRPEELEEKLETPFFGERRVIIVDDPPFLRAGRRNDEGDDKGAGKGDDDHWQRVLARAGDDVVVVLVLWDKVDSRRKIYKWLTSNGTTVECVPLKGRAIVSYVQDLLRHHRGIRFEAGIADRLAEIGGDKLGVIHQELDKLLLYTHGQSTVTLAQAETILSPSAEVAVFALTDAVVEKDLPTAAALMDDLIRRGEAPLLIFATLVRHVRLLLTVWAYQQRGLPASEMATQLGLHPFVAQKVGQQVKHFDIDKLRKVLEQAADKDLAIKTGRISQGVALDLMISELAQARR